MTLNDSHCRFGNYRLRRTLARALTAMLCLAVVTAGVLHNTVAHADDHGQPAPVLVDAAGPSPDDCGDGYEQGQADSCVVATGCFFWLAVSNGPELRSLKADVISRADSRDWTRHRRAPTLPPPRPSLSI